MFTVLVYLLDFESPVLIRRISHVISVEFKDGFFSVCAPSSDGEPDIILVEPYYYLACFYD